MTILLLGGTGRTSTQIARRLDQVNVPYILASRSSKDCAFDWLDDSTYSNPFSKSTDITSVYLIAPAVTDIFTPMKKFIDLAQHHGVTRFVLLSASALEAGGPAHGKVHEYLTELGVEYAVLRPTWFMENFSEAQHSKTIREESKVYSAAEEGKIPWVSVEDIAAVGFHALVDQPSMNKDPVILGPGLLSYDDVSRGLSLCAGHFFDNRSNQGRSRPERCPRT